MTTADRRDAARAEGKFLVAASGYCVREIAFIGDLDYQRRLVYLAENEPDGEAFEFAMADQPALFLRFTDLPAWIGGQAVIEWANQYGWLGDGESEVGRHEYGPEHLYLMPYESIAAWERERDLLDAAVILWFKIREGGTDLNLDRYTVRLVDLLRDFPERGLGLEAASYTLADAFYKNARVDVLTVGDATGHFSYIASRGGLLEAMWLQFREAAVNEDNFVRCQICEQWMAAPTKRAVYCGDACSMKAARARKRRALEMKQDGRPLAEIASEVGSSEQTVLGWFSENAKQLRRGKAK